MREKNGVHGADLGLDPWAIVFGDGVDLAPAIERLPSDAARSGHTPDLAHGGPDQIERPAAIVMQIVPASPWPIEPGRQNRSAGQHEFAVRRKLVRPDELAVFEFPGQRLG
ncbi:hypothetical protein C0V97_05995 [Asaia sp. W19]|nr:hypothetical protein C0V97_05995 [Asaia sp. W19]